MQVMEKRRPKAQIEDDLGNSKSETYKELALKELELQAQSSASATADPTSRYRNSYSPKLRAL